MDGRIERGLRARSVGGVTTRRLALALLVGFPALVLLAGWMASWRAGTSASAALVGAIVAVIAGVGAMGGRRGSGFAFAGAGGLVVLWSQRAAELGPEAALTALGFELAALSTVFLLAVSTRGFAAAPHDGRTTHAGPDPLTGLPSAQELDGRIASEVARSRLQGTSFALVSIEVEGLASVSRELGRSASHEVLGVLAERIASTTRTSDVAARVGSDGFRVLLDVTTVHDGAEHYAVRLFERLREPVEVAGARADLGIRIGVARCPDDECDAAALVRAACSAMACAERSGGVRFAAAIPAAGAALH